MSRLRRRAAAAALLLALLVGTRGSYHPVPKERDGDLERLDRQRRAARRRLLATDPQRRDPARMALARACEELAAVPGLSPRERGHLLAEAARWWSSAGNERGAQLWRQLAEPAWGEISGRARLELAHHLRRQGAHEEALHGYSELALDSKATHSMRDRARWWCARTHELLGEQAQARRAWLALALDAGDACMRVRAWDRLGCSYLAQGESQRAREILARCERECMREGSERTPTGERVRAALASMTVRRRLAAQEQSKKALPKTASGRS